MGIYSRYVLPRLIHLACGTKDIMRQRAKVVPQARGRVLEVGVGSGHNLGLYRTDRVERLWALDPAPEMLALAEGRAKKLGTRGEIQFLEAGAEDIPLDDATIDTVVLTYTLCTIPDPDRALAEMRRVLAPDGRLVFCEHGSAPDASVRRWQERIEPLWKPLAGGCHLTRDTAGLLGSAGFTLGTLETGYLPGPRPMTFNSWGEAHLRPAGAVSAELQS